VYWVSIFFWKSWMLLSLCLIISKCHGHSFCSTMLFVDGLCVHPDCGSLSQARLGLCDILRQGGRCRTKATEINGVFLFLSSAFLCLHSLNSSPFLLSVPNVDLSD
jgi:hypothetical protein